jgi:CDP-diacylglycerol---glycerol-3-phosphate 3-phosphatidyltransferase
MLDGRWRTDIERRLRPVGTNLGRTGITADHLTLTGVVMAVAAAVAIGNGALNLGVLLVALTALPIAFGNLPLGLLFLVLAALPDALDGAVAKASGTASPRGAFFDSVADRVTDALLLGGVAWYLSTLPGQSGRIVLLPMAVLAASMLISYERAKAESLGFDARGGLMERAERLVVLGVGLLFASTLLVPVLWLMLALTTLTAVQRFAKVWRQASAPVVRPVSPQVQRWRARRVARPSGQVWRQRSRRLRRR